MKTECPHCNTIFTITEVQLDLADGMVRCGVCSEVFNALVQDDLFVEASHTAETATTQETEATIAAQGSAEAERAEAPIPIAEPASDDSIDHDNDDDLFGGTDGLVVPDHLRYQDHRPSILSSAGFSIGILLTLCTLALQFAWLERSMLMQSAAIQPWIEPACERFDCSSIDVRVPDKIEMTSRNVYTHPTVDDALMISLSLVNRAGFAQPYPDIRIHFSDVIGNLIASRQLQPHEYLGIVARDLRQLEPDAPVSFGIGIVDPGERALTYEFEFL